MRHPRPRTGCAERCPSAGCCTALFRIPTGNLVQPMAMPIGEIWRGQVLSTVSLKEKPQRIGGLNSVFIPFENKRDP